MRSTWRIENHGLAWQKQHAYYSKFYGFVNLKVILQNTCRIKYFFPYKGRLSRSQRSKLVYKASCCDCDSFCVGKKPNVDCMTGRTSISKLLHNMVTTPLLQAMSSLPSVGFCRGSRVRYRGLIQDLTRRVRASLWKPKKGKTKITSFLRTVGASGTLSLLESIQTIYFRK